MSGNVVKLNNDFPCRMRKYREKLYLTQSDLADKAGISQRSVNELESGRRDRVLSKTIMLLAEALEISYSELIGNGSNPDHDLIPTSDKPPAEQNKKKRPIKIIVNSLLALFAISIITGFVFNKDKQVYVKSDLKTIEVRHGLFKSVLWSHTFSDNVNDFLISPSGDNVLLVALSAETIDGGCVTAFDINTGTKLWTRHPDVEQISVAFNPSTVQAQFTESAVARGLSNVGDTRVLVADDFDGDGDIDVFEGNYHDFGTDPFVAPSRLYENDGTGSFIEVPSLGFPQVYSANWFDMDGDGDLDVLLIEVRGTQLLCFRNDGDMMFSDITADCGLDGVMANSFDVCDFDGDSWLDIVLSRDDVTPPVIEVLVGDGAVFTPHFSWPSPTSTDEAWDLVVAFDWDGDLDPDLMIHDGAEFFDYDSVNYAIINEGAETGGPTPQGFPDYPPPWGSPAWIDVDRDGDWDYFCGASDHHGGQNRLVVQGPAGTWNNIGEASGLWAPRRYTQDAAWGDFDLDGLPDLFHPRHRAFGAVTENMLYRNTGANLFEDVTELLGMNMLMYAVPCVWFDADGDGDLELLVGRTSSSLSSISPDDTRNLFFVNDSAATGHWLQIDLVRQDGNRFGRGAEVAIHSGGSVQLATPCLGSAPSRSQTPHRVTVGLGESTVADSVIVRWPSGIVTSLLEVAADQLLTISEEPVLILPDSTF